MNALLEKKVRIHACSISFEKLKESHAVFISSQCIILAVPQAFKTEYLDLELSLLVVDSLEMAMDHINSTGSHHTDCIITESSSNAKRYYQSHTDS